MTRSSGSARACALEALCRIHRSDAFAAPVIARIIDAADLERRDRDFAATLVRGVITYEGVLDETLDRFLKRPRRLDPVVRDGLRIGAYELLMLKTPAHAAVSEGVTLIGRRAPHAKGLVNAVLRRVSEIARDFPFGDPREDDAAAARRFALPLWLFQRIATEHGRQTALAFGAASIEAAPLYFAVRDFRALETFEALGQRPLRFTLADAVASSGGGDGAHCDERAPSTLPPTCHRLPSAAALADPRARELLDREAIVVADAASQCAAALSLPADYPETFLEIGAGRGTKTLLIANDAQSRWGRTPARHVAIDNLDSKVAIARNRYERAGLSGITPLVGDGTHLAECLGAEALFDAVFIDAPCSGVGTIRRHPEIRWRLSPETITEHAALGLAMLESAAVHVRPGGLLTYATCTITREENEIVLERFLAGAGGDAFECVPTFGRAVASTLGFADLDAHTLFRLRRRS